MDSVAPPQIAKEEVPIIVDSTSDSTVARPQVQVSIGTLLATQAQSSDEKMIRERNQFSCLSGLDFAMLICLLRST